MSALEKQNRQTPRMKITMDDLDKYIQKRKERDPVFVEGYDNGYKEFLVGVLLREARESVGVTQEELVIELRDLPEGDASLSDAQA